MNVKTFDDQNRVFFSGVGEAVLNAQGPYTELDMRSDRGIEYLADNPRTWNGNQSMASMAKLLDSPPEATVESLSVEETLEAERTISGRPLRRMKRRLEDGDEFDAELFLRREPDMWQECRRAPTEQKAIRVLINLTTDCKKPAGVAAYRAALLLAMVEACKRNAIAIEIDADVTISKLFKKDDSGDRYRITTRLHSMGDALDVNQIAVAVGNMGFFRVVMLANLVVCSRSRAKRTMSNGFGLCVDRGADDWKADGYDIYIPSACFSREAVQLEYDRFLKRLGS